MPQVSAVDETSLDARGLVEARSLANQVGRLLLTTIRPPAATINRWATIQTRKLRSISFEGA